MINFFVAMLSGLLFGIGLAISGMIDPDKVLNFLDISGRWDASLAFVMAGALSVAIIGFRWARRQNKPLLADRFHLTSKVALDKPLLLGAAIFGIGWGMTGYCPGPAMANLALGNSEAWWMVGSIYLGFLIAGWLTPKH